MHNDTPAEIQCRISCGFIISENAIILEKLCIFVADFERMLPHTGVHVRHFWPEFCLKATRISQIFAIFLELTILSDFNVIFYLYRDQPLIPWDVR